MRRTSRISVGLLLMLASAVGAHGQRKTPDLVSYEAGDVPIILSAPHGGGATVPGVARRQGKGVRKFTTLSDWKTDELTEKLAAAIEKKTGKRPFTVIARFHRRYIDANRPAELAYESEQAKPVYDSYHQALAAARGEVLRRWGAGILFDIHGQGADTTAVFRGTQNGKTAAHLLDRFGREALIGETSVFGQLAKQGLRVIPAVDSDDHEHASYDGGYIVRRYGSSAGGRMDAIQLELGKALRVSPANTETATKMATAIRAFAALYLPTAERQGKLRVGVYRDVGAGKSVVDLLQALNGFEAVRVRELKAEYIRTGALGDFSVLIHPGGSGGGQGRHLREEGREAIRAFIRNGGGYIGICAGAYLASTDYDWSLNVLDAKVLDRKHWARGKGTVDIDLTTVGKRVLRSQVPQLAIHYAQGPLLAPANNPRIPDYEPMAVFRTEVAKNGAPKGVMIGTTAIARGQFGKGRVICFSPHPELTDGLEPLLEYAIDHVRRQDKKPKTDK